MKNSTLKYIIMAMLCVVMSIPQIAFAQTASQSPLINQSSLQLIPQGGSATFGFVVGGTTPRKLLIRVVGPGLTQLGVTNTMSDPRCDIYSGSTQVFGNDDWGVQSPLPAGSTILSRATSAEIPGVMASVGAFGPLTQNDSAVVLTLTPGNYSVRASSAQAGSSGNVIIEVYLVQ